MVYQNLAATCGLYCGHCPVHPEKCQGCLDIEGKMPATRNCSIYKCCMDKGLEHCGLCPDVPCEMLKRTVKMWEKLAERSDLILYVPLEELTESLRRRVELGTEKWIEEEEAKNKKG